MIAATDRAALRERYETAAGGTQPTPATVEGLVELYLEYVAGAYTSRRGSSSVTNARDATRPLLELYADCPPAMLETVQLAAVRERMVELGLCRRTIRDRVGRLRTMFRWGASRGWTTPAQLEALAALPALRPGRARDRGPVRPAPLEDVEAIAKAAPEPVGRMLEVQLLTAMRPGELVAMRGAELERAAPFWTYRPASHKNAWRGQVREVHVGPRAQRLLWPVLVPGYLFVSRRGRPYTVNGYRGRLVAAAASAGVRAVTPNQVRHTAATAIREAYGLEAAQAVLGHARVETSQVYAERAAAAASQAVAGFG